VVPDVLVVLCARSAERLAPRIGRAPGTAILLRDPPLPARALVAAALALRPLVDRLLVSDRVDVAMRSGADGVHLPERGLDPAAARALLGPGLLVSASRHDAAGARAAFDAGADFVTLSPIWQSPGKGPALGLEGLAAVTASANGPVLALGGVDADRAAQAIAAGARGVAVVRAIADAPDPAGALGAIRSALDAARRALVEVAR